MRNAIITAYAARLAQGAISPDAAQAKAVQMLQNLAHQLKAPPFSLAWLAHAWIKNDHPKGLYIYGPVGRGKSMLMDLFFTHAPVTAKRRVHFHQFMQEVHTWLHDWREANQKQHHKKTDPLPKLARALADKHSLLCFDEFQVYDIADAMILARLFQSMWQAGIVVVATSNVAPRDLYKGGLQRAQFEPFIALLPQHMTVFEMQAVHDYRMAGKNSAEKEGRFFVGPASEGEKYLARVFSELTAGAAPGTTMLSVQGRPLALPHTAQGVLLASFADLCESPRGAGDFLAIARHFHTVLLHGVRPLQADERNIATRFMTLIDALYDEWQTTGKTRLILASTCPLADIYQADNQSANKQSSDNQSSEKEGFIFQRTLSRLTEMAQT